MEKLYNNILLSAMDTPSDAQHVPYLEHPPAVVDVSVGRQLFVDDFLIDTTDLQPEYHTAQKTGAPVLFPETPWERDGAPCACPKSGGVWYDEREKKFKMWYEAGWLRHMAYAESADGLTWERPDLGIVAGTNTILPYTPRPDALDVSVGDTAYLRPDSTTVWIDDAAPLEERYKLFLRNPGVQMPGIAAVSGDGIHFERFRQTGVTFDRSTMFYNPFRQKGSTASGQPTSSRTARGCATGGIGNAPIIWRGLPGAMPMPSRGSIATHWICPIPISALRPSCIMWTVSAMRA